MVSWDYDVIKQLINVLCCHGMFCCCSLFFTIWVTSDPVSLSGFMLGRIIWFIPAAESTSQKTVSTAPKFSGRVLNWFQMSRRVVHGVIPRVLLARAHHPKLDDLNSISCLLSMRLHRHANNRKFALKGIDQQPLTLSHDSEVSHDSGAAEHNKKPSVSLFSFTPQEKWVIAGIVLWLTALLEVETSPPCWILERDTSAERHMSQSVCHCKSKAEIHPPPRQDRESQSQQSHGSSVCWFLIILACVFFCWPDHRSQEAGRVWESLRWPPGKKMDILHDCIHKFLQPSS